MASSDGRHACQSFGAAKRLLLTWLNLATLALRVAGCGRAIMLGVGAALTCGSGIARANDGLGAGPAGSNDRSSTKSSNWAQSGRHDGGLRRPR